MAARTPLWCPLSLSAKEARLEVGGDGEGVLLGI